MPDKPGPPSIAETPEPPYYAVIFTSTQGDNTEGYSAMAEAMELLASKQPGYLGIESARQDLGITVSYWSSLDAISMWKSDIAHLQARRMGKDKWYDRYKVRITRVERDYGFETGARNGSGEDLV